MTVKDQKEVPAHPRASMEDWTSPSFLFLFNGWTVWKNHRLPVESGNIGKDERTACGVACVGSAIEIHWTMEL